MEKFDLIVFDIDGTLTRSKLPPDAEMAELLCQLMSKYTVAIISGANYKQFKSQILDSLPCSSEHMKSLYILPADGTVFCYGDGWLCENDAPLSTKEKERIKTAFENIFEEVGLKKPRKTYGELIEDRGSQLNFSVSFARFFKSDFFKDILKSCFDAFFFFSRKWGIVFTSPTVAITKDGAIDRQNIKILHMFGRTWETVQNL